MIRLGLSLAVRHQNPPAASDPGTWAALPLSIEGSFPVGTTRGKVEIRADQLEKPLALDRDNKDKARAAKPNYTIDTVKRLKQPFKKADRLFLLIGVDAFEDIAKWHQAEALFRECEFVVASRPGYSLADVANALPESLRPRQEVTRPFHKQAATGDLVFKGVTIHLLEQVYQPISSTAIRDAANAGKPLGRFVEPAVADYIKKTGLYRSH